MNIQINISQIENGFLVMLPPAENVIRRAQAAEQQPQPVVKYGKDYTEVCNILKGAWPISITE